jgi:hypothetical protein
VIADGDPELTRASVGDLGSGVDRDERHVDDRRRDDPVGDRLDFAVDDDELRHVGAGRVGVEPRARRLSAGVRLLGEHLIARLNAVGVVLELGLAAARLSHELPVHREPLGGARRLRGARSAAKRVARTRRASVQTDRAADVDPAVASGAHERPVSGQVEADLVAPRLFAIAPLHDPQDVLAVPQAVARGSLHRPVVVRFHVGAIELPGEVLAVQPDAQLFELPGGAQRDAHRRARHLLAALRRDNDLGVGGAGTHRSH